jgi:endonuclease/exonuclease/phosphatase family metal-dependent hydrolase
MKKRMMALSMACLLTLVSMAQTPLRVMSFNIRFDNPKDSPNHWQARREKLASQVRYHHTDLLGVQEALHGQVQDLQQLLPGFGFVGVGRDDGQTKGEYSGIFYKTERLELLQSATFWLSLTPEVPGSKSWDAAITRLVTWARFKDKKTGKIFFHFNTHFDHIGQEARRQSARLLLQQVQQLAGSKPVIVTGDFNAKPTDEPIRILLEAANPQRLTDTYQLSATGHYGPMGTFNAFSNRERDEVPIDYIFVKGPWRVQDHATLSQTWGGLFASDHFAVLATVLLP